MALLKHHLEASGSPTGTPRRYQQRHIQLGNEESVNEDYWHRFEPIASAIWERDPGLILVVGDFQYEQPIRDPFSFQGSLGGNTSCSSSSEDSCTCQNSMAQRFGLTFICGPKAHSRPHQ